MIVRVLTPDSIQVSLGVFCIRHRFRDFETNLMWTADTYRFSRRLAMRKLRVEPLEPRCLLAAGIEGLAWHDADNSHVREEEESVLVGRTVFLDGNQNGMPDVGETSAETGPDGRYSFDNLLDGLYWVAQVLPDGWAQSEPNGLWHQVTISNGQSQAGLDFGSRQLHAPRVIASSIGRGDVLPSGGLTYTARFDQILRMSELDASDLQLEDSQGIPYVADQFDYDPATSTLTVQYDELPQETFTLTIFSGDGRLESQLGDDLDGELPSVGTVPSGDGVPGGDFTIQFSTDVDTVALDDDWTHRSPSSSLIYDQAIDTHIHAPSDSDSYDISLDAGQTITASIVPDGQFQPTIELTGPDGSLLGTTMAAAAGEAALLPAVPVPSAGVYTVTVGSTSGSTGSGTLQLVLNAAMEEEEYIAQANDVPASAQDLRTSEISLADGSAGHLAVVGSVATPTIVASASFDGSPSQGTWTTYSSTPQGRLLPINEDGTIALAMDCWTAGEPNLNEMIWTLDLSGVTAPVLTFRHAEWNDAEDPFAGKFTDHFEADGIAISDDGMNWYPVWDPTDQPAGEWIEYSVDLTAEAAAAGIPLGTDFHIKLQQYGDLPMKDGGRAYGYLAVTDTHADPDWYRLSLSAGQTLSIALDAAGATHPTLELYDSNMNRRATGGPAPDAAQAIRNFTAIRGETYYVKVASTALAENDIDYNLVATVGATLDIGAEPGSGVDAQQLVPGNVVLGAVDALPELPVTFAVFGDYGRYSYREPEVAEMVHGWEPDFIVTTGDNNYGSIDVGSENWTRNIGDFYGSYIKGRSDNRYPEQTSPTQRFFPTVGNHDSGDGGYTGANGGAIPGYVDYFHSDPGGPAGGRLPAGVHNDRNSYYAVRLGPIHLFAVDSDHAVVDEQSLAAQKAWLEREMSRSTAPWKFVAFHHAVYTSGPHQPETRLQWPFDAWGADAVFSGHNHNYERVMVGDLPYFVSGLGGSGIYRFLADPVAGSEARYDSSNGSMRVTIDQDRATFEFFALPIEPDTDYQLIDTYTIEKPFDIADDYTFTAAAGDVLMIETATPFDGPLFPENRLDPILELYGPDGTLLAVDDNGAADESNALLNHTATVGGTYTVRVSDEGESGGQYVLRVTGATATTDDAYESNDVRAEAFDLSGHEGVWLNQILGPGTQTDRDWYKIASADGPQQIFVALFDHAAGNLSLELLNARGSFLAMADGRIGQERINFARPLDEPLYLRVTGDDAGNLYDLRWQALTVWPGDANLDGMTDLSDFNIWNANKIGAWPVRTWATGDFNGDGMTDLSDFNIWNANKFTSAPVPAPPVRGTPWVASYSQEPAHLEVPDDAWHWLYGHAGMTTDRERSSAQSSLAMAVDRLLATYWP